MLLYGASVGQSAEGVPMTVTPGGDCEGVTVAWGGAPMVLVKVGDALDFVLVNVLVIVLVHVLVYSLFYALVLICACLYLLMLLFLSIVQTFS